MSPPIEQPGQGSAGLRSGWGRAAVWEYVLGPKEQMGKDSRMGTLHGGHTQERGLLARRRAGED